MGHTAGEGRFSKSRSLLELQIQGSPYHPLNQNLEEQRPGNRVTASSQGNSYALESTGTTVHCPWVPGGDSRPLMSCPWTTESRQIRVGNVSSGDYNSACGHLLQHIKLSGPIVHQGPEAIWTARGTRTGQFCIPAKSPFRAGASRAEADIQDNYLWRRGTC